ncbi:aminopeptidase [Symbioplanes lichenis]|uniref:aminopeptidase n=1 Tax=Symbioplanes lichenis TaxID=1629072 RepID=UPI002739F082|nr:aminopeptidase [Actinoplanes lichenis]
MTLLERYANLVVRAGVNLQPGQGLVLATDTAHLEIARAVTEAAYAAGAAFVEPVFDDGPMRRSALDHLSVEQLTADRPWVLSRNAAWDEAGVAFIALVGSDPAVFEGADPALLAARRQEEARTMRKVATGTAHRWSVIGAPNPGWARQIFGEPDTDRLWEVVATALRLDDPDPVAAWRARADVLASRAARLDALELTEVRYTGDGTDLRVGLVPGCRWTGGGLVDDGGTLFMPNLPTEEVFTSPHRDRAEGTIRLTKPVVVAGQLVTGLRATFSGGRVTEVTADAGAEVVRAQLDTDEGARRLGEVSLVDRDSRIAAAGIVFHNTLFDENAGCHVAWGNSFAFALPSLDADQRLAAGLNTSLVHTDVVIGGDGLTVTATGRDGEVTLLRDDEWVLP